MTVPCVLEIDVNLLFGGIVVYKLIKINVFVVRFAKSLFIFSKTVYQLDVCVKISTYECGLVCKSLSAIEFFVSCILKP